MESEIRVYEEKLDDRYSKYKGFRTRGATYARARDVYILR